MKYIILILIIIGMFANFGLSVFIQDQKVHNEDNLDPTAPCFIDGNGGCFTIQTSYYANTLGISNPLYGIFFFTLLCLLLSLVPSFIKRKHKFLSLHVRIITGIMILGSLFSIWLLYIQFFVLKATCIYCLWVDGIMIVSTVAFIWLFWKEIK